MTCITTENGLRDYLIVDERKKSINLQGAVSVISLKFRTIIFKLDI